MFAGFVVCGELAAVVALEGIGQGKGVLGKLAHVVVGNGGFVYVEMGANLIAYPTALGAGFYQGF